MWRAVPAGCRGGPDRQEAPPGREDTYRKHTIKQVNNQKYPMPSSVWKLSKAIWGDVDQVTAFTCTGKEGCFLEMCVQSRVWQGLRSPEAKQRERLLKSSLARKSVVCCRPMWWSTAGRRGVVRERPESGRDRAPLGLRASKECR